MLLVERGTQLSLGNSQGGFRTKHPHAGIRFRTEDRGKALIMALKPGQGHEAPVFELLLGNTAIVELQGAVPRLPIDG